MSEPRAANVVGIGAVSCLGHDLQVMLDACLAGRSGIALDAEFGVPTGRINAASLEAMRAFVGASPWAARVFAGEDLMSATAPKALLMTAYALAQAASAVAGFAPDDLGSEETGLIFATTTGHMAAWERALPEYAAGRLTPAQFAPDFRAHHLGRSLDAALLNLGWRGPLQVLTSACAAGTQALVLALSWLRSGKVKRCLVGGTETLTNLTMKGFGCFDLLAKDAARPFDDQRSGINLGEAAAFFCLDRDLARPSLGYVLGGATTLDGFDMTRPEPEGRGIHKAMSQALKSAGLAPEAIAWLYAHGTGTRANDAAEGAAARMLFGDGAAGQGPWVSSTKGAHGHALAASGLIETALALGALARGVILPSTGLTTPDPTIPLTWATAPVTAPQATVLKATLGFGGVNAACILAGKLPGSPA